MIHQYGQIEKYDFESTQNGTIMIDMNNGWVVVKQQMSASGAQYTKYAPARDFYDIVTDFRPNGMMRSRGKGIGSVKFGIYEEFDENGNLIKLVDEDKKFEKIKPMDIVAFLEKEGWFNRKTGENKVAYSPILPTNGHFYDKIMGFIRISFISKEDSKTENGFWQITIEPQRKMYKTHYTIDGDTGRFEKKETFEPREE